MAGKEIRMHSPDEYKQPQRAIHFTLWLENQDECESWYEWFRGKSIPVAILRLKHRLGDRFAVYRNWSSNQRMKTSGMNIALIKAANGF